MSSLKQCLIIVVVNPRFLIKYLIVSKNYKSAPKIKYKRIRSWEI